MTKYIIQHDIYYFYFSSTVAYWSGYARTRVGKSIRLDDGEVVKFLQSFLSSNHIKAKCTDGKIFTGKLPLACTYCFLLPLNKT